MLPAREGDCLWIRYGMEKAPKHVLIDAGRSATYKKDLRARLMKLRPDQRIFELFVITHIDRDHIEGALALLEDEKLPITFKEIWFNGYDHLKSAKLETFGAIQGERLTTALLKRKAAWNKSWKAKAVAVREGALPKKKLDGGLTLTMLSPDRQKLTALIPTWEQECKDAGLIPGTRARRKEFKGLESFGGLDIEKLAASPFSPDTTKANGSSIAMLAEYKTKCVLLAADAHVDRLIPSLKTLKKDGKRLRLDAFKVPHHGSEGNVSEPLLDLIDCTNYLISTNGSYFKHPKAISIARLLKFGGKQKTLSFNYRSKFTSVWDNPAWKRLYGYDTVYSDKKSNGTLRIVL